MKNTNFLGYNFFIDKGVLIPRFETEGLVVKSIEIINQNFKKPTIIDLGCGSGIIGITIKKEITDAKVTCIDLSEKALEITTKNSKTLNAKIKIKKSDMLKKVKDKYDVIISNPPYISKTEIIEEEVFKNEPHNALFAKDNGLYYYKQILSNAKTNLNNKNLIAFEIGCNQAQSVVNIAKEYFPNAKIMVEKDLNNKDRYIFIENNL